jgi:hypothetical protein
MVSAELIERWPHLPTTELGHNLGFYQWVYELENYLRQAGLPLFSHEGWRAGGTEIQIGAGYPDGPWLFSLSFSGTKWPADELVEETLAAVRQVALVSEPRYLPDGSGVYFLLARLD